jgi:hypothetical protein
MCTSSLGCAHALPTGGAYVLPPCPPSPPNPACQDVLCSSAAGSASGCGVLWGLCRLALVEVALTPSELLTGAAPSLEGAELTLRAPGMPELRVRLVSQAECLPMEPLGQPAGPQGSAPGRQRCLGRWAVHARSLLGALPGCRGGSWAFWNAVRI